MKKLKLNLEDLKIESFETSNEKNLLDNENIKPTEKGETCKSCVSGCPDC